MLGMAAEKYRAVCSERTTLGQQVHKCLARVLELNPKDAPLLSVQMSASQKVAIKGRAVVLLTFE